RPPHREPADRSGVATEVGRRNNRELLAEADTFATLPDFAYREIVVHLRVNCSTYRVGRDFRAPEVGEVGKEPPIRRDKTGRATGRTLWTLNAGRYRLEDDNAVSPRHPD
ncbi:hypothetical protein THAOC_27147, partial [Thalassiosira oceanica]